MTAIHTTVDSPVGELTFVQDEGERPGWFGSTRPTCSTSSASATRTTYS